MSIPTIHQDLSDKILWRKKQLYEIYQADEKLAPLARVFRIKPMKNSQQWRENYTLSIGVLQCRDKDDEVVEYALSRNLSSTLIAQYQLQLPDKKLIQAKLHELYDYEDSLGWETQKDGE